VSSRRRVGREKRRRAGAGATRGDVEAGHHLLLTICLKSCFTDVF